MNKESGNVTIGGLPTGVGRVEDLSSTLKSRPDVGVTIGLNIPARTLVSSSGLVCEYDGIFTVTYAGTSGGIPLGLYYRTDTKNIAVFSRAVISNWYLDGATPATHSRASVPFEITTPFTFYFVEPVGALEGSHTIARITGEIENSGDNRIGFDFSNEQPTCTVSKIREIHEAGSLANAYYVYRCVVDTGSYSGTYATRDSSPPDVSSLLIKHVWLDEVGDTFAIVYETDVFGDNAAEVDYSSMKLIMDL